MEHYIRTRSVRSSVPVSRQTKPFSYQASKCVLEHLEANTRLLLVSHCLLLRNQHIITPLKISYLSLGNDLIKVNDYEHVFVTETRRILVQGVCRTVLCLRYSVIYMERKYHIFEYLPYFDRSEIPRKFMQKFILKGLTPFVNKFHISWCPEIFIEPKFRVQQLQCSGITLDKVKSHVDSRSFPVKKLTLGVYGPEDDIFKMDLSTLTNFLRIELLFSRSSPMWGQTLSNLHMEAVQVYSRNDVIANDNQAELARNWVETSREAGTKYTFQYGFGRSIFFLQRLSNRITALTGIPYRKDDYHECFSFEMNHNKTLNIYLEYGPYEKPSSHYYGVTWVLAMEIV